MEVITQTVLHTLEHTVSQHRVRVRHINTRVNRSQDERERFRLRKLSALAAQFSRSAIAAAQSYEAYYPISQNRIGVLRDLVLLLPFRLLGHRITIHLHGAALDDFLSKQPAWLRRAISFIVSRNQSSGIVLTESLRKCLEPIIAPENIRIVPNTVRIPATAASDEIVATADSLRVLFLGTLMPIKGYRELIIAVNELAQEGLDVTLDLAGELRSQADSRWLRENASGPHVRYHGPVARDRKWQLMRETNVIAIPSTALEGQPLAVLEGMATGHAIIATAQGGIAETVADAAVLLPPVRGPLLVTELRRGLHSLASPASRTALTTRAHERFQAEFSPGRFADRWLDAIVRPADPENGNCKSGRVVQGRALQCGASPDADQSPLIARPDTSTDD
jgi:glycosyltransferase involved in cell wall biosynthesis